MEQAIKTAQAIVDSVADIRPEYKGKTVAAIEHDDSLVAGIIFSDKSEAWVTGLYAKQILRHLPPVV